MNKALEQIRELLDNRANELQLMKKSRIAEIDEAKKKFFEAQEHVDNAQTAEDFVKYRGEMKDAEDTYNFLASEKNRAPQYNLTKEEYDEISGTVTRALENLREEYALKISEALETVTKLAEEYTTEAEALEQIENDAHMLHLARPSQKWRVTYIEDTAKDPTGYIHAFYRAFFPARRKVVKAIKALKNPIKLSTLDNEEREIYENLKALEEDT